MNLDTFARDLVVDEGAFVDIAVLPDEAPMTMPLSIRRHLATVVLTVRIVLLDDVGVDVVVALGGGGLDDMRVDLHLVFVVAIRARR